MARVYPRFSSLPQEELLEAEDKLLSSPGYPESIRFWLRLVRESSFEWHPPRIESDLTDNRFSVSTTPEQTAALMALAGRLGIGSDELILLSFHLFMSHLIRHDAVFTSYCHRVRTSPLDLSALARTKRDSRVLPIPINRSGCFSGKPLGSLPSLATIRMFRRTPSARSFGASSRITSARRTSYSAMITCRTAS